MEGTSAEFEDREMEHGEDGDFAEPGFGLDEPDSDEEADPMGGRGAFDDEQEEGEQNNAPHGESYDEEDDGAENEGQQEGAGEEATATKNDTKAGEEQEEDMPFTNRLGKMMSARSNSASSRGSRPGSAVINLRGSRPSSAAIAQEIEGFEDDFMERVEEEDEEQYQDQYEDEEEDMDMGPTVDELVDRGMQEQQRLLELNDMLQRRARLALDFRNKGRPPVSRDNAMLDGVITRYKSALKLWVETLEERDRVEGHYQSTIFDMKSMLEERIKRADDIGKAYKHFKVEVAKSAENTKTGRPISERQLAHLEQEDQEKEEEVQRVRLKNIHLSNQLKRIEQMLKQKEELAEGLHLIDFEQLKIENQSLNEKIEERNEELLKLRKKTTATVQILTHVREKLQFVERENAQLSIQLEEMERDLSERRDRLGKAKSSRDTLRLAGRKIKEASVYITNSSLLDDMEVQREKREQLMMAIDDCKIEYSQLTDIIERNQSRILQTTEDLAQQGSVSAIKALRTLKSATSAKSGRSVVNQRVQSVASANRPKL